MPAPALPQTPASTVAGYAFAGIGVIVMLAGLLMPWSTTQTEAAYPHRVHEVANLGAMHQREMAETFGGFLLVAGCILLTAKRRD
jgi:hypothetical protein